MATAELATRELLEAAARVCTDLQLRTLVEYEDGWSLGSIARRDGVTKQAVRDRIDGALLKIGRELRR